MACGNARLPPETTDTKVRVSQFSASETKLISRFTKITFGALSLGTLSASLIANWFAVPTRWQPAFYMGVPVAAGLVALLSLDYWNSKKTKALHSKGMNELTFRDKLILSMDFVDREWHEPLLLSAELLEESRFLFSQITDEIAGKYDPTNTPKNWRYKIASEMAADILRIVDSIHSQLVLGHPDTEVDPENWTGS